ncbi:MAG: hypothetical protein NVSMB57_14760 [Actinomycetota bacterium]
MKRYTVIVLALSLLLVSAAASPARAATPTSLLQIVTEEAEFILSMRTGDGVIATTPDGKKVVPYHSNIAAIGLAHAYEATHNRSYSTVAWRWLEWYRDNMLDNGTIADHIFINYWQPVGLPDSTDSYAGTYLSAILATFEATGDITRLEGVHEAAMKAITAIELTKDDDGLHFARPGWPFKYSMDEAEAYAGLVAAQRLATYLNDNAMQARAAKDAAELLTGSAHLVDRDPGPGNGLYLWAIHHDGTKVRAPIEWIYPGASAQAWAVADGLITGDAAKALMQRVDAAQPNWDTPAATTQYYDGHPLCAGVRPCVLPVSYWTRFAVAWLRLGDAKRALDTTLRIRSGAIKAARAYPFTPGDSGQIITVLTDPNVVVATETPIGAPVTIPRSVPA